ncbi:MAG: glycosyl transferase [Patescibacteria group bacterium]|nr:MAG: glycosyl transferase [Patescibacteria group bacterium]
MKKKILMITPYVPYPPASGGQIRTLNLLKYLKKDNDITLICLYKTEEEKQLAKKLEKFCNKYYLCKRPEKPWKLSLILKTGFSTKPFLITRNYSKSAERLINKILNTETYSAIHAETFYTMPHLPETNLPIILVEQTIEYNVYKHFVDSLPPVIKHLLYIDILKLKRWERIFWKKADIVACVSTSDEQEILNNDTNIKTVIIPNGAGDEMFVKKLPELKNKKPILLFVGNFLWLQNTEAANFIIEQIAPKLQNLENLKIVIAGQNIKKNLTKKQYKNLKLIEVRPEDSQTIKKLYRESFAFISPIQGPGGTRLKILGAMASGLPIIGSKVSVSGLNVSQNKEYILAEKPEDYVKAVKLLLKNKDLYQQIQKNAYDKAVAEYSWKNIAKKLNGIYNSLI